MNYEMIVQGDPSDPEHGRIELWFPIAQFGKYALQLMDEVTQMYFEIPGAPCPALCQQYDRIYTIVVPSGDFGVELARRIDAWFAELRRQDSRAANQYFDDFHRQRAERMLAEMTWLQRHPVLTWCVILGTPVGVALYFAL